MNLVHKLIPSFLTLLFCTGCAMTHPGKVGETSQKDVVVSLVNNRGLSDNYYLFVEYTIENTSGQWLDLQVSEIAMGGVKPEIITDDKLMSWIEGAEHKLRKARYNTSMILGSMAAIGSVAAVGSSNKSTRVAGTAVSASAAAGMAGVAIHRAEQNANSGIKGLNGTVRVPSTHILTPFKVAPESFVRRWVVFAKPKLKEGSERGIYRYVIKSKFVSKKENSSANLFEVKNKVVLKF